MTARRPAVIVRDERTAGWQEGGTYERDWRMGDLVAYERGEYYRAAYPSTVTVGLANACDDRTVVHDGYHTGPLEARHDPETGLWYAVTMSGEIATIATPIRIVEKPAIRFTPKASLFFFAGGALAFVLTLLLFVRGRRFGRLQHLEEVIVVGKDGRTTTADGTVLTLVPPPPLGSVVLVVDVQAEGARTDPYRERPERTTARWVPWTRDRARHQETTALALAAALYVVTMGLGIAALMQTS